VVRRVRERFQWEARSLRNAHGAPLWAMEHRLKDINHTVSAQIRTLRQDVSRGCAQAGGIPSPLPQKS
jgi:hypothetical protein